MNAPKSERAHWRVRRSYTGEIKYVYGQIDGLTGPNFVYPKLHLSKIKCLVPGVSDIRGSTVTQILRKLQPIEKHTKITYLACISMGTCGIVSAI